MKKNAVQRMVFRGLLMTVVGVMVLTAGAAQAAYVQVGLPLAQLPQDHEYQKTLRVFMATLTEQDFKLDRREFTLGPTNDLDRLYRIWLLTLNMPHLGAATLPAVLFTLPSLESEKGIRIPTEPHESQMLAWLAHWDYPGNPYHNSRALKLRAFVLAATDLMLLDALYEHDPQGADRSDYLGANLIWAGYAYGVVKDVLPAEVLAAFEALIKKQVLRLNQWGPKGAMTDMDLFAPVGLSYIAQASSDPEVKTVAESYAHRLFTDPHYFHSAGYFVDNGCFDTSYNGISLYFATWAAIASDWPFVREALDKAFRLRAHLCFPDPDGAFEGPSAMSSRTSGDPSSDQWNFPQRPYTAAMVTDEALYLAPPPSEDKIRAAPLQVIQTFNAQMTQVAEAKPGIWKESHWSGLFNFAYEHYKNGAYAKLLALTNSPLMKPLYRRNENFIHEFDKAFVIARFDAYALAIHTGPVGRPVGHGGRPYGFGGGQLSVFWTPGSGSVILGRRRGVQGAVFDSIDEWRSWPNHAVTGITTDGEILSSSRIEQPDVAIEIGRGEAGVRASGVIPKYNKQKTATSPSGLRYERRFVANRRGLTVETSLKADGRETLAELYETIPVFLRDRGVAAPTAIEFRSGKAWTPATAGFQEKVGAIRLKRFDAEVIVTFKKPQRVKLSPADWVDGFQTQAACRTILVDLLAGAGKPAPLKSAGVSYTITAVASPAKPATGH